jgi:hypothetical protein
MYSLSIHVLEQLHRQAAGLSSWAETVREPLSPSVVLLLSLLFFSAGVAGVPKLNEEERTRNQRDSVGFPASYLSLRCRKETSMEPSIAHHAICPLDEKIESSKQLAINGISREKALATALAPSDGKKKQKERSFISRSRLLRDSPHD